MAPPQPSLNPPMVLPSLPKSAELKLAAKSVSVSSDVFPVPVIGLTDRIRILGSQQ